MYHLMHAEIWAFLKHKYLQITNCCLQESHSVRITEATGFSGNSVSCVAMPNTSIHEAFYCSGHCLAGGATVLSWLLVHH